MFLARISIYLLALAARANEIENRSRKEECLERTNIICCLPPPSDIQARVSKIQQADDMLIVVICK